MQAAAICLALLSFLAVAFPRSGIANTATDDSLDARIIQFITHPPIDTVPYDAMESIGPRALPKLRSLLGTPDLRRFDPQILSLIGYLGDASDTPTLKHYILERSKGEIDLPQLQAIFAALLALGWLSDHDPQALAFLRQASDPRLFEQVTYKVAAFGDEGLRVSLSQNAINAIGRSAKPEAEAILLELQRHPYHESQKGNIAFAIDYHRAVKKVGRKHAAEELRRLASERNSGGGDK